MNNTKINIDGWKKFDKHVRMKDHALLQRLDEYPNSILVAGCQRSGTTMLSRTINNSQGISNHWFMVDEELCSAVILSGHYEHKPQGRYCFQTTYLNERYGEYYEHLGHKIIWVLRNPFSVTYSMLNNWKRSGFNRLFKACGAPLLDGAELLRYEMFGHWGVGWLHKACLAYIGKVSQVIELNDRIGNEGIIVVDYDNLVMRKEEVLKDIYDFINLDYKKEYCKYIHSNSIDNASKFSKKEIDMVELLCMPIYLKAKEIEIKRE